MSYLAYPSMVSKHHLNVIVYFDGFTAITGPGTSSKNGRRRSDEPGVRHFTGWTILVTRDCMKGDLHTRFDLLNLQLKVALKHCIISSKIYIKHPPKTI